MKLKLLLAGLALSWLLAALIVVLHKDSVQLVKLPPASLAQWYKPANKRQAWLHNMFKLRRELQAIEQYAKQQQAQPLASWIGQLDEHYRKISEMVPQWQRRLEPELITQLFEAQQAQDFAAIEPILTEIKQNCNACHQQFSAVTALLYRAPDFENMALNTKHNLSESMTTLNKQVNQIKIAITSEQQNTALTTLSSLREGMDELGGLCLNCHEHSLKNYPDTDMSIALDKLEQSLHSGTAKQQGRALGAVAVGACAQCHGTHRIAADARKLLSQPPVLKDLLRH